MLTKRLTMLIKRLTMLIKRLTMLIKRLTMLIKRFVQPTNIILNLENCQSTNVSKYIGSYK